MGLHIARVEIQNFRNFEHLVIDPFPAAAVIVGENGAGKSNLLHALRVVLDPSLPDSSRMLRAEDFHEGPHGKPMGSGGDIVIRIDLAGYDEDIDALSVLADASMPDVNHRARFTYVYRPRSSVTVGSADEQEERAETPRERSLVAADYEYLIYGGDDVTNDARHLRRDVAIRVLPALRDVESDLQTWRRNPLRDILDRLPPSSDKLHEVASDLAAAMDKLSTDSNIAALERNIADRLNLMIGAKNTVAPSLGFASTDEGDLVRFVRLFIDAARRHTVGDTSLGGANVLYLALLLESLTQQRNANAFVATLLAVEEPEAHLHVAMQRRLFHHLLRSESALILTTHSPHIAAVAPLASYVILRSTPTGTVGATTAAIDLNQHERADLERYMDQTRAELLFASHVILVEGLAETHLVPAIAQACGFNLDEYGVVVASVQGTDFAPYTKLVGANGLAIPFVVITDGDIDAKRPWAREGGLRRAIRLVPPAEKELLEPQFRHLRENPEDDAVRGELLTATRKHGVFVGLRTLEVDLCTLVPEMITAAYEELPHTQVGLNAVSAGVSNDRPDAAGDPKVRDDFLARISALGKGRFAQRLAAHVAASDLSALIEEQGVDPEALYLLAALNTVSLRVRQKPLFEAWAPDQQ
ncbi:ATP-dependent endonuclease [Actinomycetota bacterium]|nr:ATP-dependent endonuclease [Actinomycetota bacterium]